MIIDEWKNKLLNRAAFVRSVILGTLAPLLIPLFSFLPNSRKNPGRWLRPPGAKPEASFLKACIGCGQCANVCPNKCISLFGLEGGLQNLGTPMIQARAQACILCMACTQVCPTAALNKLEPTEAGIQEVDMGTAIVSKDLCYSFSGRTCGVCYRACPLPGKALRLGLYETPIVNEEECVGCGLCEQACVHMPQAIRIIPRTEHGSDQQNPAQSIPSKSQPRHRFHQVNRRSFLQQPGNSLTSVAEASADKLS